jgi:EmrB/QacA subfamily drug resistance transporter
MFWTRLQPKHVVAIIYVMAIFASAVDTQAVNVALPRLSAEFHASPNSIEWVVTGYLLSLAVWVPASGWLGDRFGTKRMFLVAIVTFTVASALCGIAQNLFEMVLFRILQGVGGGMMAPIGFAMLMRAYPPAERASASRVLLIPITIGPASGPVIGGFLLTFASWRWVFYLNLPIGILAFTIGALLLEEHREPRAGSFDLPGFLLSGTGLGLILYALSQGPSRGWSDPQAWGSGLVAVIVIAALIRVELSRAEPMLQLRLLSDRLFRSMITTASFTSMAFLGMLFTMPLFLQVAHGSTPFQSGLTTFTEAIGVMTGSQVVGRLYPTIGPRRLMATGQFFMAMLLASMALFDQDTNLWIIRGTMYLLGVSMSCVILPNQAGALARIAPEDTGRASAIMNALQRTAAAMGVAVLATVLALVLPAGAEQTGGANTVHAFHVAFLTASALAFTSALLALRIHDSNAITTMRRPRAADEVVAVAD